MDSPVSAELLRLKSENLRLKWIIGQMMQRWSKGGMALFRMDAPNPLGLAVHEDPNKKLIEVRVKRMSRDPDNTETSGPTNPN
jgi:glycosidase